MSNINPNPWGFSNVVEAPPVSKNTYNVVYYNLNEIAMGGPLGGQCYLEANNKKIFVHEWCGGPPIWDANGQLIALPIWTCKLLRGTVQQIGIVDTKSMTLRIFSKTFRVLYLHSFNTNIIRGCDSPIYKPTDVTFDIGKEDIKTETRLT